MEPMLSDKKTHSLVKIEIFYCLGFQGYSRLSLNKHDNSHSIKSSEILLAVMVCSHEKKSMILG